MEKFVHFDKLLGYYWPAAEELRHYFLAPSGQEWFFSSGDDTAGFWVRGRDAPDGELRRAADVDIDLYLCGHPDHGVLLQYDRRDGRTGEKLSCNSRGDLSRLREWVRNLHGTLLPVGLFVPFDVAWPAVKEFLETEGELPTSIEWIAGRDLPPDAFPEP